MPKYFDIHSHPNFPQYNEDREAVLNRLEETDTFTIGIGTNLKTSREVVELADKHERIYASVGIHPIEGETSRYDISYQSELIELAKHPKVVAIGECGMDFFHSNKKESFEMQKELFIKQIEFAVEHELPIMIHARNSYEEILEVLEPMKEKYRERLWGNAHFFAGSVEMAKRFLNIGFTMSFTGVITFTHDYDEVIKFLPIESIMAETDAPYVAPVPYRGKRNEPSYVSEVVKRIAEIRGDNEVEVEKTLVRNTFRVFNKIV